MKKLVTILIILSLLYIIIASIINRPSRIINYKVNNINITEHSYHNKNISAYAFSISVENNNFTFSIISSLKRKKKIIQSLTYDNDLDPCLNITLKNKETINVCLKNNIIYLNEHREQSTVETQERDNIIFYQNVPSHHKLITNSYKNLIFFDNSLNTLKIFNQDIYNFKIKAKVDKYLVVPDYNMNYTFNNFYKIDITTGKYEKIYMPYDIYFDAYIMGIVDNKIYLLDEYTKKQYCIDIKKKNVKQIGDIKNGFKYYNIDKWEQLDVHDLNRQTFKYRMNDKEYSFKIGDYEVKYIYEQSSFGYKVYRKDNEKLIYLFTTTDFESLIYLDDYIYYKNGAYIYLYNDLMGSRKLMYNAELNFNNTFLLEVYKK